MIDFQSDEDMDKYFRKIINGNLFVQIKLFTELPPELQDEFITYYKEATTPIDNTPKSGLVFKKKN